MTTQPIDLTPYIAARDGVAVTIYSKPECVQCNATYRALDKKGIEYTVVDVSQDSTALRFILDLGYKQAPVVYVSAPDGEHHWSGFDFGKIREHITERAA